MTSFCVNTDPSTLREVNLEQRCAFEYDLTISDNVLLTSGCSGYGDRGGYRGGRDGGRTWNEERGSYERGGYRDGRGGGFGGQGGRGGGGGGWGGDRDNGYNNGRWQEDRGNRDGGFDNFNRGGGGGRYVFAITQICKADNEFGKKLHLQEGVL